MKYSISWLQIYVDDDLKHLLVYWSNESWNGRSWWPLGCHTSMKPNEERWASPRRYQHPGIELLASWQKHDGEKTASCHNILPSGLQKKCLFLVKSNCRYPFDVVQIWWMPIVYKQRNSPSNLLTEKCFHHFGMPKFRETTVQWPTLVWSTAEWCL